jgi:hypothetical protein
MLASQEIWGKDTIIFFEKVEKDIFKNYFSDINQIAFPSLVGVTGLAGAGVFGGIFLGIIFIFLHLENLMRQLN